MRAWPRSDVSCDGVTATCSFIPQAIIDAQCLIAYNLLVNPEMITGTPGGGGGTQAGTYVSSQELGDLKFPMPPIRQVEWHEAASLVTRQR